METKYQISILSLLILIISFSVYFSFSQSTQNIIESENLNVDEKLNLSQTQIKPIIEETIIEKPKQTIYTYEEALISGDVLNCNLIENLDKQTLCESKLGTCNTDACLFSKALESSNRNDCYEIENEDLKLRCSFETFKTKIFDSAVLENNLNLCDEIDEEILNQRCKDNFYFVNSLNSNDITFCDKIIQSDLKEACYNEQ
jgi:hypothetical protein